ncbi:hypothetical protein ET495_17310 (plasmid) [Xylanimonas allomyrinae]|uniref:Uncharacterized protein n=1 Tax=Xylanimonas allomyrinae TaxID=2509459 RepID=A0A4P6EPU7_9MICO|nr:hypothetical protein [Xylanimonas allomyrinae]QAY64980.1 hypothetical protein ET495_17310 [Xylanimonas allomyrinae]
MRPAFRELGDVAGLVFEALELGLAHTTTGLIEATGFSPPPSQLRSTSWRRTAPSTAPPPASCPAPNG